MKCKYRIELVKGKSFGIVTIHAENDKEAEKIFRERYGYDADLLKMKRLK